MKLLWFTLLLVACAGVNAQSVFIPENGNYKYELKDIAQEFNTQNITYITLDQTRLSKVLVYKLDSKRNEYQIKNWYQYDWFLMQDWFHFDVESFMKSQSRSTFNDAKRKQYSAFAFDHKKFFHAKTVPAMKEWGGLTHPPIKKLDLPLERYDSQFAPIDYATISSPYFSPTLQNEIDRASQSELSFGNIVLPLADNEAYQKKKLIIQNARESILFSSLVFVCDKSGREIADLLIEKRLEGVDVKVMTDKVINKTLANLDCIRLMRAAGIDVVLTKDFFKHKKNAINHTKTLITDFSEAIAGGQNMVDADNLSRGTDFMNRDVDLYMKGPMVNDVTRQFIENWEYQSTLNKKIAPLTHFKKIIENKIVLEKSLGLRGKDFYGEILGNTKTRMNGVCRFIKQAPYEDRHTIGKAYLKILENVQNHLVITDPAKSDSYVSKRSDTALINRFDNYEMFNELHTSVQNLAKKGLSLDYITTNINMAGNEHVAMMNERIKNQLRDNKKLRADWSYLQINLANNFFGKPHYKNLMKDWMPFKNVHIWTHMSFMHSKIFYFDRVLASVGSYNFHHNSTDHAYESTAICLDENLNRELDKILVKDMANSIPLIFSSSKVKN
jgi:phosphatidylserine/phosphatidylglycerophosphate/cardiolipin synthase-like enzyme